MDKNKQPTPALIWHVADKPSPFGIGGKVSVSPLCSDCQTSMTHVGIFPKGSEVYQIFYCFVCQKDNVSNGVISDGMIEQASQDSGISNASHATASHATVVLLPASIHQKIIDELEQQQLKVWENQQLWLQQQDLQAQKERLLERQSLRDDPASQIGMDFEDEEFLLPPVATPFTHVFAQGNAPSPQETSHLYLLSEDHIPVHASFARPKSFAPQGENENYFIALSPVASVVSRKKVPYTHKAGQGVYTQGCGLSPPPQCSCCQKEMRLFLHIDSVSHEQLSFPDMSSCCVYFCVNNPENFTLRCEKSF